MKKFSFFFALVHSFVFANSPAITVTKVAVVDHVTGTDSETTTGDTIVYTITIANTGNVTLTGIDITDTMTDGDGQSLTLTSPATFSTYTLAPGETEDIQATYTIEQSAADTGSISNTVSVVGTAPDGTEISDDFDEPVVVLTDPNPDMEVIKTAFVNDNGDGLTGAGDFVRYSIEVTNTGDITLDNVNIQDETLTDGNGTLLALSSGPDYWQPQTVEVGESVVFTALYVISQEAASSGFISNTATAVGSIPENFNGIEDVSDNGTSTDEDGDGDPDNDPTVVFMDAPPVSSIEVTKVASVVDNDGDNTNSLGDTINYTITVVNTGNTDLRDVVLDDVISDLNGDPLTLSYQPIFDNASLGSIGGNLRQGETATYNASFIITQQAIDAGGVSNTVTVIASSPGKTNDIFDISDDGDDTDGNTQNDPTITRITTITPSSSIVLTKAASISDTNGDGTIGLGDTITYTLVATNTGNDALSGVTIADTLSDLAGNSLTLTTLPTFINASLGSPHGSLQIGEQATYHATFIITSQAMNAGGVSNTATVSAINTSGTTLSNISDDPSTTMYNDPTVTALTSQPIIDNENILLNGNVYITKSNGLIIKSGDDCFRIKVNNGNVVAEPVNCE